MLATHPDTASRFVEIARQIALPPLSRCCEAMLATYLRPLSVSAWPDIAWQSSRLTRDGCPVEFAFCGNDSGLRMTIEPARPEAADGTKLGCALRILEAMGQPRPDHDLSEQWERAQAGQRLRWGTWLGLRQTASGLQTKLYVEMPSPGAPSPAPGRLHMIGYEPETERSEFYYSLAGLNVLELSYLLARYGVADPASALEQLAELIGLPAASALHWLRLGMSIAKDRSGETTGITLFFRASAAYEGQARIRDALLRQQSANGIGDSTYRALFAEISALPDHGVVALNLSPNGSVSIGVGISGTALLSRWNAFGESAQAA